MTVTEAFQVFKSELEHPDRKQAEAAKAQKDIRDRISAHLPIENSFLTGSYARYTKINPLNDIDVFLVRNKRRTGVSTDGSGIFPATALDGVQAAVEKAYPYTATVKKQNRSVNVQISGLPFGFDLTPAWLRDPDGYWIPDTHSDTWTPSDPDAHATRMTEANELNDGKLKPVVKMVKHWSRNNFDRIASFHIELICADIFDRDDIDSFQLGVATVLVHLPDYVRQRMMDPIYGQCQVNKKLTSTEEAELMKRISYDATNAIEALRLENTGYDAQAIEKWKHIFMSGFPR
jgi:hypothetical protein